MDCTSQISVSDVLCTTSFANLHIVLKRKRHFSSDLELMIVDIKSQSVLQRIEVMNFEGLAKEELNYHLFVDYRPAYQIGGKIKKETSDLVLVYPNGIFCFYENLIGGGRNRLRLNDIITSEYERIIDIQVLDNKLLMVSNDSKLGPVLVIILIEELKTEIQSKKSMSDSKSQIIKLLDLILAPEIAQIVKRVANPKEQSSQIQYLNQQHIQSLRVTDVSHSILFEGQAEKDILSLISLSSGHVVLNTITNRQQRNKVFQLSDFEESTTIKNSNSEQIVSCLDFLQTDHDFGLILTGDRQGYIGVIQMSSHSGNEDSLMLMSNLLNAHEIMAVKWLSFQQLKFCYLTAWGELCIYSACINREDTVAGDSMQVSQIAHLNFSQLSQGFRFDAVDQIGSQCLQMFANSTERNSNMPETLQILWPDRILSKASINQQREEESKSQQQQQVKTVTQMSLHSFSLRSKLDPLNVTQGDQQSQVIINQDQVTYKSGLLTRPVVFASGLSSNGSTFLSQLSLHDLVPQKLDDQIVLPPDYEHVFYIDEAKYALCSFSNVSGKQKELVSLKGYVPYKAFFTDLQYRWHQEVEKIKFLLSFNDASAQSLDQRHQFISFTFSTASGSLSDQPKTQTGLHATFLVGSSNMLGQHDNFQEPIVYLDKDPYLKSSANTKLIVETFIPFPDKMSIDLQARVSRVFNSPIRSGKALLYHNISDGILQFSKNRSDKAAEDDFSLYRKNSFKFSDGETLMDVKFLKASTDQGDKATTIESSLDFGQSLNSDRGSKVSHSSVKCIILTNQRVYTTDKNLMILQSCLLQIQSERIQVQSVSILQGCSTLLLSSPSHLLYVTQEKGNSIGTVMSYQKSDQRVHNTIVGALPDRVILAKRQNLADGSTVKSMIQFETRDVSLLEPILMSYLTTCSEKELDTELVQRACKYFETVQISPSLAQKLDQMGFLRSSQFLQANTVHFESQQKLSTFCKTYPDFSKDAGLQRRFFEILFPSKNLELDERQAEERNELALRLKNDPQLAGERAILRQQYELMRSQLPNMNKAQISYLLQLADLLQHSNFILKLLKSLEPHQYQALIQQLASENQSGQNDFLMWQTNFSSSKIELLQAETISHQSLIHLITLPQGDDKVASKAIDNDIQQLNLAYGDKTVQYQVLSSDIKGEHDQIAPSKAGGTEPLLVAQSESLGQWIGYANTQVASAFENQGRLDEPNEVIAEAVQGVEAIEIEDGVAADDLNEKQYLLGYWRVDEGSGDLLNDVTDNKLQLQTIEEVNLGNNPWHSQLDDGDPLDQEDKWGKQASPNWCFELPNIRGFRVKENQAALGKQLGSFTFEFWLRPWDYCELSILERIKVLVTDGMAQVTIDGRRGEEHVEISSSWVHIALAFSSNSGLKLFVNSEFKDLIPMDKALPILKLEPINLIKAKGDNFFVTELRLWSCCLTQQIISENYKQPLAFLAEQRKKLKVNIQKKKPLGGKQNFGTNVSKLSGLSKLDKKLEHPQTNVAKRNDFEFNQSPSFADPAPGEKKEEQFFDFQFGAEPELQEQAEVKEEEQAPKMIETKPSINAFEFESNQVEAKQVEPTPFSAFEFEPEVQEPKDDKKEIPVQGNFEFDAPSFNPKQQPDKKDDNFDFNENVDDDGEDSDKTVEEIHSLGIEERQTIKTQVSSGSKADDVKQTPKNFLQESNSQQTPKKVTNLVLKSSKKSVSSTPKHNMALPRGLDIFGNIDQLISYCLSNVTSAKLGSILKYIRVIVRKAEKSEKVEMAGITLLLPDLVQKVSMVFSYESLPVDALKLLCAKMIQLAIQANHHAFQNMSLARLLLFYSQNKYLFEYGCLKKARDYIEAIEFEEKIDYGSLVSGDMVSYKCPQCQTKLLFGLAQPKCFECQANLIVCQATLQLAYNDSIFVCRCRNCSGIYERSWVVSRVRNGERQCPGCDKELML